MRRPNAWTGWCDAEALRLGCGRTELEGSTGSAVQRLTGLVESRRPGLAFLSDGPVERTPLTGS